MYNNPDWKEKLIHFSKAATKWGCDKEQTDRMNASIKNAHLIDAELYRHCKYTAELYCLQFLQKERGRHPRDDELKKAWHQFIPVNIPMKHPQQGHELK